MSFMQMSLSGAVMIAAITVMRALTLHRVPKQTFLLLWAAALLRLLLPFSLPFRLSIYSLLAPAPKASLTAAVGTAPAQKALQPLLPGPAAAAESIAAASALPISVWNILWAAGFLLCAIFFSVSARKCRQKFQQSFPVQNAFTQQWLCSHPLRRKIALRQSCHISSPLTFGVRRPVILLPASTNWQNKTALKYVLEHEFVHIQRFDALFKLMLVAPACMHWFNPLVWVMLVLANRDIELFCDETVVRRFGRGSRASYARVLISMEEAKSGFAPLCSHFSKSAIEERITAIMKVKKATAVSFALAAMLVCSTVTVFATSAQSEAAGSAGSPGPSAASGAEAVESGEPLAISVEYLAAGIALQNDQWCYQKKPIAALYDDNGSIYMNGEAADGLYLNIQRNSQGSISGISTITQKRFRELADRHMNASVSSTSQEDSLLSYTDPADGKTYYSFDEGKTFEPMTDAEFEARFPTPEIEWWTYEEYKAWLDNEKVQLQSLLGEKIGTNTDGELVWTQEKIDETISLYESILNDMQNGIRYSKSVDGQDDTMLSYNPADIASSSDAKELYVKLDNGEEKSFGPYETNAEMLAAVKPFCEQQVKLGNMSQSEADEIIARYSQS